MGDHFRMLRAWGEKRQPRNGARTAFRQLEFPPKHMCELEARSFANLWCWLYNRMDLGDHSPSKPLHRRTRCDVADESSYCLD